MCCAHKLPRSEAELRALEAELRRWEGLWLRYRAEQDRLWAEVRRVQGAPPPEPRPPLVFGGTIVPSPAPERTPVAAV